MARRNLEGSLPLANGPDPFNARWYAFVDAKTYGPYSGHDIKRMASKKEILGDDLVCREGLAEWNRAKDDPILQLIFNPPERRYKFGQGLTLKIGRRLNAIALMSLLTVIAWVIWPYYSIYRLAEAARTADTLTLESSIAWDSVRQGLRADFNALYLKSVQKDGNDGASGLAVALGPTIINNMVESYITPQSLANIVRTGKPVDASKSPEATTMVHPSHFPLKQIRYAFFSGNPFTFEVQVEPDANRGDQFVTLIFNWAGNWKLTRIMLPLDDAKLPTRAASPSRTTGTPAAETQTAPRRLEIRLISKTFRPSNYKLNQYQDVVEFAIQVTNLTKNDIRAFDGTLTFTDLLDNVVFSSKLAINEVVVSGGSITWNGKIDYNQFIQSHQSFRNEAQDNLKTRFVPKKLLYTDGRLEDLSKS